MQIQQTTENDVPVLSISGRLIATTSATLENAITSVLKNDNKLILDFSGVDFMASSGIRTLLVTSKRVKSTNGSLILRNVKPVVMNVLEMTGLKDFLDIR